MSPCVRRGIVSPCTVFNHFNIFGTVMHALASDYESIKKKKKKASEWCQPCAVILWLFRPLTFVWYKCELVCDFEPFVCRPLGAKLQTSPQIQLHNSWAWDPHELTRQLSREWLYVPKEWRTSSRHLEWFCKLVVNAFVGVYCAFATRLKCARCHIFLVTVHRTFILRYNF